MAQDEEVTFELLVYSGTRWEAQGTYGAKEQMIAVADAKSLAKVSTVKGVKVVKEFFDGRSNVSRSLTVFEHTPQAPSSKPRAAQSPRRGAPPARPGAEPAPEDEKPDVKRPTFLGTFVKIMLSIVFALAAAAVVMQMASFALQGVRINGPIDKGHILILVGLLVFAITALALVTRILMGLKRIAPLLPSLPSVPVKPKPAKHKRDMRLTPSVEENKAKEKAGKAEAAEADETPKADESETRKMVEEAERRQAEEEARKKVEEERKRAEDAAETDALSEIITIRAFTDDAFDVLDGDKDKQEAHTVFGLVLFLVGAVHAMRSQNNLPERVTETVAVKALSSIGLNRERAKYFMEHTDEYLVSNPRYSHMFQAGRSAMTVFLDDDIGPRGALSEALEDWAKPKSQADKSSQPVTVLFTDIAGSTAMTQKLGDAGAQDVVRAHNKIVRDALQSFTGKEIKHTGDGIMASFPSAVAGVEAAIDMQKQTKVHNATDPAHPLGLKIGLNAGDPISEDDDLFGTTVQLAARIVDKAGSGQILVSGSVHGLTQGKNLKFARFADLDMKGFDESVTVYEALWDVDGAKPAATEVEDKKQPEPKAAPDPKPQPAPKAEPKPAPQAAAKPAAQPAPQAESKTEAKAEVAPAAKPNAQKPSTPVQPSQTGTAEKARVAPAKTATPAPVQTPVKEAQKSDADKPKA